MNNPLAPTPEELAKAHNLPLQYALIDFDLHDPMQQVIGSDPMDLANIPFVPVKTVSGGQSLITIVAHPEESQEVANLLAAMPALVAMVVDHAPEYLESGELHFALTALNAGEIENVERNTESNITEE